MELGLHEEKLIAGLEQKYKMSLLGQEARECSKNDVAGPEGHTSQLEEAPSGQIGHPNK